MQLRVSLSELRQAISRRAHSVNQKRRYSARSPEE